MFAHPSFHDAGLTERGISASQQASAGVAHLVNSLMEGRQRDLLLVSSPLSRAIGTARHLFPDETHLTVLECVREFAGLHSCDSRRR